MAALVLALPQLFVWDVVSPYPDEKWAQCVTQWESERELARLRYLLVFTLPSVRRSLQLTRSLQSGGANGTRPTRSEYTEVEAVYNIFHLLSVFYIPLSIICICYTLVVLRVRCFTQAQVRLRSESFLLRLQQVRLPPLSLLSDEPERGS